MRFFPAAWAALFSAVVLSSCMGDGGIGGARGAIVPYKVDALIYQGTATAFGDAEALAGILDDRGLSYRIVDSGELDSMTVEQLQDYGVILWPGGYAGRMSNSLEAETREKIRVAVNEKGVSFVGICAGAFIAVSPDTSWGFSLIDEETLPYFYLESEGVSDAMVTVRLADGSTRELVWWGGPKLPDYPGGVVARYEDTGEAAIAQKWAGRGLVILSGPHPEAPADWRTKLGLDDADGMDTELAGRMIEAALNRAPMQAMN